MMIAAVALAHLGFGIIIGWYARRYLRDKYWDQRLEAERLNEAKANAAIWGM